MVEEYNSVLRVDGWEIYQTKTISNKPVFGFRTLLTTPHLEDAAMVAERLTGAHIAQQVRRLRAAADADPELAIGTSKEFLESVCRTILTERGAAPSRSDEMPELVRSTIKMLSILPSGLPDEVGSQKTLTVLLSNLGSVGHRLAELRNQFGTGHGRATGHVGLTVRHAKLAIGAASALAVFLYECHESERGH
jgi:hypothetical protein